MSRMVTPQKDPRTGIYYFRMAIPKDLIPVIGKTVLKNSLKTKSLAEAKQRITAHQENAFKLINLAKLKLSKSPNIELNIRDCAIIAERWYERTKDYLDASGDYSNFLTHERTINPNGDVVEHIFGLSDTLPLSESDIETATRGQLKELADCFKQYINEQLDREGLVISPDSDSFIRLGCEFYHYAITLESVCLARHRRDYGYEPIKSRIADKPLSITTAVNHTTTNNKIIRNSDSTTISELFKRYKQSASLTDKSIKTLDEITLQINRLIEIIGDIDVIQAKRKHIVEYRDTLLQLPRTMAKCVRSKALVEQIQIAETENLEKISATTVKNCLRKVSVVFSYAVELGLIETNPVIGVKIATGIKKTEVTEGKGYSNNDLQCIFSLNIFNDINSHKPYGMACYWIPLLCRYTGARLEEIAQLHKSDIAISEDNINFINIRRGEGQSVKTDSSLRHIPIHQHIIELGFLDYVSSSKGFIFPQLKEDRYGKKSTGFSKWWSKVVKSTGVVTNQPAHAFRHALKTALRSFSIADTVSDAITGHLSVGVGSNYGTVELIAKKLL